MRENKDTVSADFPKVREKVSIQGLGKYLRDLKKKKNPTTAGVRLSC